MVRLVLRLVLACLASLRAQKILSRTQIEVQGYAIEKVGLPQSPAPAGKGRFAFIEYWAQGKPKPGYYVECLNTQYYTQWSQPLDLPPEGADKPLRLLGLKEAIVALSYQADPLNKGAVQEAARFFDLKGNPLFPKWVPISVYDRAVSDATAHLVLSPDSSYLLWYACTPPRKNTPPQGWYAVWSSSGRKVAARTDWLLEGTPMAASPDNRANLWFLEAPPGKPLQLVYEDTKARTRRSWVLDVDTLLVQPWLYLTPKAVFVGALVPAEKTLSLASGHQAGAWVVGRLDLPFSDTSRLVWGRAPFPPEWISLYKEPLEPAPIRFLPQGDSALYVLYEDLRSRGGTFLAYDVWVNRWWVKDSVRHLWSYRIEKRQREPRPDAVSCFSGLSETFLSIVFLTERTGRGKLRAYLLNHQTGEAVTKDLAENTAGDLLILPGRSAYLGPREVITLALPPPGKNGYQIYHIRL